MVSKLYLRRWEGEVEVAFTEKRSLSWTGWKLETSGVL